MRYVLAKLKEENQAEAYRHYIADALKIIGGLNMRYADIIKPAPVETRSADEIKSDLMAKLNKMRKEG